LRSVSFVDLDWVAEEEKLRVRMNRRKEKKKKRRIKQDIIEKRLHEIIMSSTPEQLRVKAFMLHVGGGTTDDEETLFQAICSIDSAKEFLKRMEPCYTSLNPNKLFTDSDIVDYSNNTFDVWKENDDLFRKAFEWMTSATGQQLYHAMSSSSLSFSSSSGSSHSNAVVVEDASSHFHGLTLA
jgi:hypothetical protein